VPLGALVAAPRRAAERASFLAASLGALPLALAVARLGCLAAGCCLGEPAELPWSLRDAAGTPRHPTALYEAAGGAGLQLALSWLAPSARAGAALAGIGALRLAAEPLRAAPPLGAPAFDPRWLAAFWLGFGSAAAIRGARRSLA
jgi:prolipoprotein diacylglyceryltransferase